MIVRQIPAQLPIWPDAVRGGPNVLLRSAFFAGIQSRQRRTIGHQTSNEKEPEGVVIAAQDGVSIKYAGTQLNQYDADVFFEVLHRARREQLGTIAMFSGASFLEAIGRSRNNLNYEDLDNSLRRLKRGTLDVSWRVGNRPYVFVGSLIDTYTRDMETKLYRISLSPEIKTLFAAASWTQLEWEERKQLKGKHLAQWLHSYFSTHARPFPVSAAFLKEKTGSPTKQLKHFKIELRNALVALHCVLGWSVEWDGDLVKVTRPPSEAQARYLVRADNRRKAFEASQPAIFRATDPRQQVKGNNKTQPPGLCSVGKLLEVLTSK